MNSPSDNAEAAPANGVEDGASESDQPEGGGLKGILIFLTFGIAVLLLATLTPARDYFTKEHITSVVEHLGHWGPLAIVAVGIVSPLLFLPRWPIAFVSGLLYGVINGSLLATCASTLGALLHFVAAKRLLSPASDRIRRKVARTARDLDPDKAFATVFFLRAFPLSNFVATNLLAGALKINMRTYVLASFLGMIPSSIMYASWGRLMKKPSAYSYFLAVASVAVIVLGMYWARKYAMPRLKRRAAASHNAE